MVQMTSAELRSGCVGTFPVRRKKRHLDTDLVMHFHDDILKEAIRKHREDFNNEMVTISKIHKMIYVIPSAHMENMQFLTHIMWTIVIGSFCHNSWKMYFVRT